jgi:hypothetical protein
VKFSTVIGLALAFTIPDSDLLIGSTSPRFVRSVAGRMLDDQLRPVPGGQGEYHEVGRRDLQGFPGDEVEHLALLVSRQQPLGDVRAGPQPPLLAAGLPIQPGILDGHARGRRQDGHDAFIVLIEAGAVLLLGEVEIAEYLVADADRDAQKRGHRRMPGREAEGSRMIGHAGQAQRGWVGDELAEQTAALRPVVNGRKLILGNANRDETGESSLIADNPHGAVTRVNQGRGGLNDVGPAPWHAGPSIHFISGPPLLCDFTVPPLPAIRVLGLTRRPALLTCTGT